MRLKSFTGASIDEAMRQVRAELGDDAVIVSTYQGRRGRGAVVTAARENAGSDRGIAAAAERHRPIAADPLASALEFHGIPGDLATRLLGATRSLDSDDPVLSLGAALDAAFRFEPLAVVPPRPVMLVGPSGTGKTVTAAKLAARAVLARQQTHVITTDTVRAGALAQLSAFTEILKTPLHRAGTPDELARAVAEAGGEATIVIDSPGTTVYVAPEVADLRRFLDAADVEPILVLAAGADAAEAAELAEGFAAVGVKRLLVTRVDASRRLGAPLAAAAAGGLAFAGLSLSPFVAQGIESLNPVSLARLIFRDPSAPFTRTQDTAAE